MRSSKIKTQAVELRPTITTPLVISFPLFQDHLQVNNMQVYVIYVPLTWIFVGAAIFDCTGISAQPSPPLILFFLFLSPLCYFFCCSCSTFLLSAPPSILLLLSPSPLPYQFICLAIVATKLARAFPQGYLQSNRLRKHYKILDSHVVRLLLLLAFEIVTCCCCSSGCNSQYCPVVQLVVNMLRSNLGNRGRFCYALTQSVFILPVLAN